MKSVLHQTDLFHYHQDPDDHWDLACQFALAYFGETDLKGIVIDYPENNPFGDPALLSVGQLNRITGKYVSVGTGLSASQAAWENEIKHNSAIRLILDTLENAPEPVSIQIVGSCRDVAAAARENGDLFRKKCSGVYLNAGSAFESEHLEFNVDLDPASYRAMFYLPCPVYWSPCFEKLGVNKGEGVYGTVYRFRQDVIYHDLSPSMQRYFDYAIGREDSRKWLRYLERPADEKISAYVRNEIRHMWCTGPILHAAGKTVTTDGEITD
ncbi:MAG TPA: hypothetical protein PLV03_07765, partial [Clostridiales bacterium]|nr:hypothetical protein [Clostridiales bacterium]